MYRAGFHSHTAPGMSILATANSSGIAQGFLGPVPPGYCWYVERMTTWSNTAQTSPKVEVFVIQDSQIPSTYTATVGDRSGRQDLSLTAANDISDEKSAIYVPETYCLVAFWTGLTSGDLAQLTAQVAVHQLSPEYSMTRRDIRAVQTWEQEAEHERATSPGVHN